MSKELVDALSALEKEKGIDKNVIIEAMEAALVSAYKRNFGQAQNVDVSFNERTGDFHVYTVKEVVPEVADERLEISLEDAEHINKG
ncbi:MAG: transcription termination/antitermination protein NusA, partial [Bombilactobacillus sp.]|nr:transcription termination/antitermination protein NusA [Bombilactobacillus sp.]